MLATRAILTAACVIACACAGPRRASRETQFLPAGADGPAASRPAAADGEFLPRTEWLDPAQRPAVGPLRGAYRDQDGAAGLFERLVDRPMAISFFYTRCENPRKCAAAVSQMAALQRELESAGLADRVRLLLISYEPHYDTPARLRSYGASRGLRFGPGALMISLDESAHSGVARALEAPVNTISGWVNVHGVALMLLDARGRLARRYHTVLWNNADVAADLRLLADER
jgi:protein SCO1